MLCTLRHTGVTKVTYVNIFGGRPVLVVNLKQFFPLRVCLSALVLNVLLSQLTPVPLTQHLIRSPEVSVCLLCHLLVSVLQAQFPIQLGLTMDVVHELVRVHTDDSGKSDSLDNMFLFISCCLFGLWSICWSSTLKLYSSLSLSLLVSCIYPLLILPS